MARLFFSVFVVLFVVFESETITYDTCTLALDLRIKGVPQDLINNFVCLAENNSFDTEWSGGPYDDGTKNFGIFQISNNDWCEIGKNGGKCNTDCNMFTDFNITDDLICAMKIHQEFGFDPWFVWTQKCKPAAPDLRVCFPESDNDADVVGNSGNDEDESSVRRGSTESVVKVTSTDSVNVRSGSTEPTSTARGSTKDGHTIGVHKKIEVNSNQDSNAGGNFFTKIEKCFSKLRDTLVNIFSW